MSLHWKGMYDMQNSILNFSTVFHYIRLSLLLGTPFDNIRVVCNKPSGPVGQLEEKLLKNWTLSGRDYIKTEIKSVYLM